MKYYLVLIIAFLSCKNVSTESNNLDKEIISNVDLKILFYNVGVEEDPLYSINIGNQLLEFINYRGENLEITSEIKKLTSEEFNKINSIVNNIEYKILTNEDRNTLDTWEFKLYVKNKEQYNELGFSLGESKSSNVNKLLEYILSIHDLDIKIYGFK